MRRFVGRGIGLGAVVGALLIGGGGASTAYATSPCNLGPSGNIHHVVYVQFDNFHLRRDNPNVPSDLEQIPALKSYLTTNGTLDSNDHTILISHTAGGIISSLTGLYPDRNGINVSNSYGVFKSDGSIDTPNATAFTYWTDPVTTSDPRPNMITDGQKNTPAPWTPYTKAGCDVGAFSLANMEIENTRTTGNAPDITTVFGNPSPEASFASGPAPSAQKNADFLGIAIHCSQADSTAGGVCQPSSGGVSYGGRPDVLPDEPGGYTGFNGLFGAPYANQVVSNPGTFTPSTADANGTAAGFNDIAPPVNDVYDFSHTATPATCTVNGGACPAPTPITNGGFNGFAGFDPSAAQTLGYTAAMQEAGIPVTMAYIADAHDAHEFTGDCSGLTPGTKAQGPGQACYEQQLREYDQAFQAFFERLAADNINKTNTLFVFTVEEGDHYAGGPPTNQATCDGVHVACTYTAGTTGPNTIGEIQTNLQDLVQKETGNSTPFQYHFDSAPTVYVPNNPNGPPGPTDPKVRGLERDMSDLRVDNPRTGNQDNAEQHIADQTTQDILHMTNTDPLRTPSFTLFGNADYFFQSQNCSATAQAGCPSVGNAFAWNHGDDNPEIANTWLGLVGPSVKNLGQTSDTWTDHTDVMPTMLRVLGLSPGYNVDGDVYTQALESAALPANIQAHLASYQALQGALKQLNAPFGQFGHDAEEVSTTAVRTTQGGVYDGWTQQLTACKTQRNTLAGQIQGILNGAAFNSGTINDSQANTLVGDATKLIGNMHALALMNVPPDYTVCGSSNVVSPGPPGNPGSQGPAGPPGPQGNPGPSGGVKGAHGKGKGCKKRSRAAHHKRSKSCKKKK